MVAAAYGIWPNGDNHSISPLENHHTINECTQAECIMKTNYMKELNNKWSTNLLAKLPLSKKKNSFRRAATEMEKTITVVGIPDLEKQPYMGKFRPFRHKTESSIMATPTENERNCSVI